MEELSKPRIRRLRSGCWNCKKRRRRCTEDKPSCSGCLKRGFQCHYGTRFLWEDEAESLGIAFGRAGLKDRFVNNKTKPTVSHYLLPIQCHAVGYWLSTTSDDIRPLYEKRPTQHRAFYDLDPQGIAARKPPHSQKISLPLSQYPSLEELDLFLFHYFRDTCTIRRSLVDSDNPWRSVLLPLCFQSEGLLHIAIAWAAHSLRNQCDSRDISRYDEMTLTHKCRSIRYLRNMVPQHPNERAISLARTRDERDALLLLVMFHCLLEIATGSVMEWTYHMRGAIQIMQFYTKCRSTSRQDTFSPEVLELVYSFFVEKDTFLGTTTSSSSIIEGERHVDSPQWLSEIPSMFPFLTIRDNRKVNPCMGLSPELLDIISCISKEARARHLSAPNSHIAGEAFSTLHQRLKCLNDSTENSNGGGLMHLTSTAFEEATWIYLHHAIGGQPCQNRVIQKVHLPKLLDTLEKIHRIQRSLLGFIPYPLWALFIASCVVLEEDRVKILEWFTELKQMKPISNVPSTMAVVEAIWKRRDLCAEEADSHSSECASVWTDVISQLGWKLPFT